ncbi:MAG: hypothetical protein [Macaque stool associated virus 11]|uniref:Uncharacterized protein n=1 Tax=Macaque stool associated virus 11 TaxID=2499233 RepID=A0A345MRS0_9VIRU|nr:MAG: hypothetical protein QKB71_gp2 [Macaque stool associated virus 11]AXH74070.1 MAG: hypothetical protein [Macaque stool associated virus 11]
MSYNADVLKRYISSRLGAYWDYWTEVPTTWGQFKAQSVLGGVFPVAQALYKVRDTENKYNDYYKNQPYAGFPRYPSLTDYAQVYSYASSSVMNFVSDNIGRLYRSK